MAAITNRLSALAHALAEVSTTLDEYLSMSAPSLWQRHMASRQRHGALIVAALVSEGIASVVTMDETPEQASERRVAALLLWVTQTGPTYTGFIRAIQLKKPPMFWLEAAQAASRFHESAFAPETEPAPTVAEVLALACALESHFRAAVAEAARFNREHEEN